MQTVIYFDGGDDYKGQYQLDLSGRKEWALKAKVQGHKGYLVGHRYFDNQKDMVFCYFKTRPDVKEIKRRRDNGFIGAKWYYID